MTLKIPNFSFLESYLKNSSHKVPMNCVILLLDYICYWELQVNFGVLLKGQCWDFSFS